jgi:hypothetical protein
MAGRESRIKADGHLNFNRGNISWRLTRTSGGSERPGNASRGCPRGSVHARRYREANTPGKLSDSKC